MLKELVLSRQKFEACRDAGMFNRGDDGVWRWGSIPIVVAVPSGKVKIPTKMKGTNPRLVAYDETVYH